MLAVPVALQMHAAASSSLCCSEHRLHVLKGLPALPLQTVVSLEHEERYCPLVRTIDCFRTANDRLCQQGNSTEKNQGETRYYFFVKPTCSTDNAVVLHG